MVITPRFLGYEGCGKVMGKDNYSSSFLVLANLNNRKYDDRTSGDDQYGKEQE